jgi:ATP-dependent Lon protease
MQELDFQTPDVLPSRLPVVPLRRGVLLPGSVQRFGIGRRLSRAAVKHARDGLILVAVQRDPVADPMPADLLPIAVLGRIVESTKDALVVQGLARVTLTGFTGTRPYLEASFEHLRTPWPETAAAKGVATALRKAIHDAAEEAGFGDRARGVLQLTDPGLLADGVAALLRGPEIWRREFLTTPDPIVRSEQLMQQLEVFKETMKAQRSIQERVKLQSKDIRKEHILRQQLEAIQKELGQNEGDDLSELKSKLADAPLPDTVRETVDRELRRLGRINAASPERSVAIDWLTWIAELPWETDTAFDADLDTLQKALDRSHHGLDDVKRQVVEHLAVRKLAGNGRADVLLLVGPPGVGKTSIGNAIATATGRKLVRVALGGVRDEAELRGHRRTYIGARPGRLIEGIRRAGTSDPVVLLDEIDKLGMGARGNPAAALLEILDPEQNHAFTDHYLEVPFDLSRALFVATANDLSTIPAPLRDRMEILHIEGYSPSEKLTIARDHLLERLAENAGLDPEDVEITDDAIADAIDGWTRESGVRQLQRVLGRVYRAAAVRKAREELDAPLLVEAEDLPTYLKRRRFVEQAQQPIDRPGIANGLAWTPVGGTVLTIEATRFPGNGRLILTGQLGDVMKESARTALSFVLANHELLGVDGSVMESTDLHVHVPAGGVPKDGPSAGVTMVSAIASLLSGREVDSDLAMTGEATLRGRVLPVGGIKSKLLAAHRRGLKRVLIPKANEPDLEDLPQQVRDTLDVVPVDRLEEVLIHALKPAREQAA